MDLLHKGIIILKDGQTTDNYMKQCPAFNKINYPRCETENKTDAMTSRHKPVCLHRKQKPGSVGKWKDFICSCFLKGMVFFSVDKKEATKSQRQYTLAYHEYKHMQFINIYIII